ncbi:MAG: methionine ABC transporter ATP-binding protein [Bacilli bacterium]|nr:methionine ABC transporter ATP-binding protein [Bacilli bacterium]MBN2876155.1 methionine ABC transporter ATP-binding protein [Bacilli bacterium]
MITLENITKQYIGSKDEIALNQVSARFDSGLIHGIIGISGAGKSTLIRLLNQLESYDKGNIQIFDYTDLRHLNKESTRMLRKQIGMIFQTDHLLSRKTVLDNILLPISFHRKITSEDKKFAQDLLQEVGLSEYSTRYPEQLSGGQRQRVGIARALINKPSLLLCDEPTSALDVITTGQILQLIKATAKNHSVDVIIVTHDMYVIREICDTVTVMDKGRIVEHGDLDDILFKAKHPQTQAFVKEIGLDLSSVVQQFDPKELLLLKFDESIVKDSIISEMIQTLSVTASIVYANVTPHRIGIMVIHAPKRIDEIKLFLEKHKVVVEDVI